MIMRHKKRNGVKFNHTNLVHIHCYVTHDMNNIKEKYNGLFAHLSAPCSVQKNIIININVISLSFLFLEQFISYFSSQSLHHTSLLLAAIPPCVTHASTPETVL